MKGIILFLAASLPLSLAAQKIDVTSPDGKLVMTVDCDSSLSYNVRYDNRTVVATSPMGFEFDNERPMASGFSLLSSPVVESKSETWYPVVKNKHDKVEIDWNETVLSLKEKEGDMRRIDISVRVYNEGVAFRYTLFGGANPGDRKIIRELTGFSIPKPAKAWVAEYLPHYRNAQEGEFIVNDIDSISANTVAALPLLIEEENGDFVAITEAYIDNFPGFYIGGSDNDPDGHSLLTTKLAPLPGQKEDGIKALFNEEISTPWRIIFAGHNPGRFIESEIIHSLNPPCAIKDPSWIKPGLSAWDHWWSGEVKMETDTIKKYIDMAAAQGWPYMLIDWQWYGPFNRPEADITKPAPQIDMPGILDYAKSKGVKCWLWLYCSDVNRNDAYKKAFPLYNKWGIAGVKIDFMDRDDQEMVNWYRDIISSAAENKLMIDLHGSYKPDGIDRTYPNMLTREGVMGGENYKWSKNMTPEHNITLAFTRMLAGHMDYTPGGFINVTAEEFKNQSPTLVSNTRSAELSKFVIYDSPFTVVCEHPDNLLGQPGADFMQTVPTVWDDTRFLSGYPGEYVAIAKRDGDRWFVGALNNSKRRDIELDLDFLPQGKYNLEFWADTKQSDRKPTRLEHKTISIDSNKPLKVSMAKAGGYAAILTPAR